MSAEGVMSESEDEINEDDESTEEEDVDDEDGEEDSSSDNEEEFEQKDELLNEACLSSDSENKGPVCSICLNHFMGQELGSLQSCTHTFCFECIYEWAKKTNTCPLDRIEFSEILVRLEIQGCIIKKVKAPRQDRAEEEALPEDVTACEVCQLSDREDRLLLCDGCDLAYHCECLTPPLAQVPRQEWFCPPCSRVLNRAFGIQTASRRAIPRTIASETVRSRIQSQRALQASPAPSHRSPRKRIVRRRRRRRQPTKPKLARTKKSVGAAGKGKSKTAATTKPRRRRKTRRRKKICRKKKTVKQRTQRSSFSFRRLAAPSTKGRLADHLGLCKPPPGHTMPYVKKGASGTSQNSTSDGPVSYSLFGSRDQLMDFDEDFTGVEAANSSSLSRVRQEQVPSCTVSPVNILDSIMLGQEILHTSSKKITIGQDGSLQLQRKEKAATKPQIFSDHMKKEKISVKKERMTSLNDETTASTSHPKNKVIIKIKTELPDVEEKKRHLSSDTNGCSPEENLYKAHVKAELLHENDDEVDCLKQSETTISRNLIHHPSPHHGLNMKDLKKEKTCVSPSTSKPAENICNDVPDVSADCTINYEHHVDSITSVNSPVEIVNIKQENCLDLKMPALRGIEDNFKMAVQSDAHTCSNSSLSNSSDNHNCNKTGTSTYDTDEDDVTIIGYKVKEIRKRDLKKRLQKTSSKSGAVEISGCELECKRIKIEKLDDYESFKDYMKHSHTMPNEAVSVPVIKSEESRPLVGSCVDESVSNSHEHKQDQESVYSEELLCEKPSSEGKGLPKVSILNEFNTFRCKTEKLDDNSFHDNHVEHSSLMDNINDFVAAVKSEESGQHHGSCANTSNGSHQKPAMSKKLSKEEPAQIMQVLSKIDNFKDKRIKVERADCLSLSSDSPQHPFEPPSAKRIKLENEVPCSKAISDLSFPTVAFTSLQKGQSSTIMLKTEDIPIPSLKNIKREETNVFEPVKKENLEKEVHLDKKFHESAVFDSSCKFKPKQPDDCAALNRKLKCIKKEVSADIEVDIHLKQHAAHLPSDMGCMLPYRTPEPVNIVVKVGKQNEAKLKTLHYSDKIGQRSKLPGSMKKMNCKHKDDYFCASDQKQDCHPMGNVVVDKSLLVSQIENAVKQVLKPFYHENSVSKENYKMIMKKCVPKILKHSGSGVINLKKIQALVLSYISMYSKKENER